MSRICLSALPALMLAAGWLTWGLAETAVPKPEAPPAKAEPVLKTGKELRAALAKRISLEKGIDPNTPLKDALDFLSEETGVNFIIDSRAFEAIGIQKPEEQPVTLPKMRNIRLGHVLRLLLGQLKGEQYVGTYLVRNDHVEVTSNYATLTEVSGQEATELLDRDKNPPRVLSIVHVDFDKKPLNAALEELAEASAVSIIVDPRVGEKARNPISGTFNNVFIDTTIHLLADMADLRAVQKDAVFYITTKENAKAFEGLHKPAPKATPFAPGIGPNEPGNPKPNDGIAQ